MAQSDPSDVNKLDPFDDKRKPIQVRTFPYDAEYMKQIFVQAVNKSLEQDLFHCQEIDRIYGATIYDQNFAFVVTKGVWYAVRLYMHEDHLEKRTLRCLEKTEYLTRDAANAHIACRREQLESNTIGHFDNSRKGSTIIVQIDKTMEVTKIVRMLRPGDHILTECFRFTTHEGIYVGDGQVIHIAPEVRGSSDKKTAQARLTSLTDFIGRHHYFDHTLAIKVYRVRTCKPEEIVRRADERERKEYGREEYNALSKNCQHFASFCACGQEISTLFKDIVAIALLIKLPFVLIWGRLALLADSLIAESQIRNEMNSTRTGYGRRTSLFREGGATLIREGHAALIREGRGLLTRRGRGTLIRGGERPWGLPAIE